MMPLLRRPRALCFDLFGTLVEEFDSAAISRLMHDLYLRLAAEPRLPHLAGVPPEHFADAMRHQYNVRYRAAAAGDARSPRVADAIADLLVRIAPGVPIEDGAIEVFIDHYAACERLVAFPETLEVLQGCRDLGLRSTLLSNVFFPGRVYQPLLAELGIAARLDHLLFSSDLPVMKPHPDIFRLAAARLGVPVEDCLMIGDRVDLDINGALSAGMPAVLMPGHHVDASADVPRIQRLADLIPLLQAAPEYTPSRT